MGTSLRKLCGQLRFEFVNDSSQYESEIQSAFLEIFEHWIQSYEHYYQHSGELLKCLNSSFDRAQIYLLEDFIKTYGEAVRLPVAEKMDLSVFTLIASDNVINTYREILAGIDPGGTRFSDINVNLGSFSSGALKELLSMLLRKLEDDAAFVNWNERQLKSTTTDLLVIRAICKHQGCLPLFYHSLNIFFDKLFTRSSIN